jgi:acetyl-CoA carboxylase carboxyl transferase subunit beta
MVWFRKSKEEKPPTSKKIDIPHGLWIKCPDCGDVIFKKKFMENFKVCPKCSYHFRLGIKERIEITFDRGSFKEFDSDLSALDPLDFKAHKSYADRIKEAQEMTGLREAAVTGEGTIKGYRVVAGLTDANFMRGSMGSVVGEKITRAIEKSIKTTIPFITISGSGGGARMDEGMLSLMQMAKTSAAVSRLHQEGILYISVMTDPTMGGVNASFASLGDIIIAEPKALIGFAGPRVIEQTIRQKLPEGFQRAEFMLKHGQIDMVVHRRDMVDMLAKILSFFSAK